jgi:hypothetical protein
MKKQKKNILYLILGVVTWFIIDMIWDRKQTINDFEQGFKDGIEAAGPSTNTDSTGE